MAEVREPTRPQGLPDRRGLLYAAVSRLVVVGVDWRSQGGETVGRLCARSSDIERILQIGVHGPRTLHVVVCDAGPAP